MAISRGSAYCLPCLFHHPRILNKLLLCGCFLGLHFFPILRMKKRHSNIREIDKQNNLYHDIGINEQHITIVIAIFQAIRNSKVHMNFCVYSRFREWGKKTNPKPINVISFFCQTHTNTLTLKHTTDVCNVPFRT